MISSGYYGYYGVVNANYNSDAVRNFVGLIVNSSNLSQTDFDNAAQAVAVGYYMTGTFMKGYDIVHDYLALIVRERGVVYPTSTPIQIAIPNFRVENSSITGEIPLKSK